MNLTKKALQDGDDPYIALLNFRTSPTVDGGPSPAFKVMQRNPRTLLPSVKLAWVAAFSALISPARQTSRQVNKPIRFRNYLFLAKRGPKARA